MKTHTFSVLFISALCLFCSTRSGFTQSTALQSTDSSKSTGDGIYQQIRHKGTSLEDFSGVVATVNGLTLQRDAATFKFNNGEIYFLAPVEGRVVGAVFLGDVEMRIVPPT